jgi:hypothetical protein
MRADEVQNLAIRQMAKNFGLEDLLNEVIAESDEINQ